MNVFCVVAFADSIGMEIGDADIAVDGIQTGELKAVAMGSNSLEVESVYCEKSRGRRSRSALAMSSAQTGRGLGVRLEW